MVLPRSTSRRFHHGDLYFQNGLPYVLWRSKNTNHTSTQEPDDFSIGDPRGAGIVRRLHRTATYPWTPHVVLRPVCSATSRSFLTSRSGVGRVDHSAHNRNANNNRDLHGLSFLYKATKNFGRYSKINSRCASILAIRLGIRHTLQYVFCKTDSIFCTR